MLCQAEHTAKEIGHSVIASKYESSTGDGGFDVCFADLKNRTSCIAEVWLADKPDAQMPPHLDRYFAKLCSMINGHFTQVEMEDGIDRCRNYWQYIGVSEENNGQRGKGRKPPKEKER